MIDLIHPKTAWILFCMLMAYPCLTNRSLDMIQNFGAAMSRKLLYPTFQISSVSCVSFLLCLFFIIILFTSCVQIDQGIFLSHHKLGAAVLSRWFKMLLAEITPTKVFLDSDDVSKLDAIIDVTGTEWWPLYTQYPRIMLRWSKLAKKRTVMILQVSYGYMKVTVSNPTQQPMTATALPNCKRMKQKAQWRMMYCQNKGVKVYHSIIIWPAYTNWKWTSEKPPRPWFQKVLFRKKQMLITKQTGISNSLTFE